MNSNQTPSSRSAHSRLGFTRQLVLGAAALLATPLCGAAFGQTVLLDQQPSQLATLYAHWGVESNAEQFVLTGTGGNVAEFTIWGTWPASGSSNSDTFDVHIRDDAAGSPGPNFLASFTDLSPVVTATGLDTVGVGASLSPEFKLDFVLPAPVQLGAGTYWLETYSTGSSGTGDWFAWEMAPLDATNGLPCVAWAVQNPGITWNVCTPLPETDLALVIRGAGSTGINYCPPVANSTGAASIISAAGSPSIAANALTLRATNLPAQPGIFIAGPTPAQIPFFNGFLCIAPTGLQRFATINTPTNGVIEEVVDLSTSAPGGLDVVAGSSYYYQRWNRDPAGGGGNANFSDGLEIQYVP